MNFSEIRKTSGMTQAAFAETLQIPKRTVEAWDTGNRTPPPYVLKLLEYYVKTKIVPNK